MSEDLTTGHVDHDALQSLVRRLSSLYDDRDEINQDVREVYKEAKKAGLNLPILREIVREYRTDSKAREARYAALDTYRHALGMLADTPLGESALARAAVAVTIVEGAEESTTRH